MFHQGKRLAIVLLSLAAVATAAAKAPAAPQAYVDTSYVVAPHEAGGFTLEHSSYDPGRRLSGASFQYRLAEHPDVVVSVYVYAAGRMAPDDALATGMQAFRTDLQHAVDAGTYAQLEERGQTAFALSPADVPAPTPQRGVDDAILAAIIGPDRLSGQKLRLDMQHTNSGQALLSNGYLFYRQLYYVKVRVSAFRTLLADTAFDALADRAARALVPAVQVVNVGDCARATLNLDVNATPAQATAELSRQLRVHKGYNCYASTEEAGIAERTRGADVIPIHYAASDWTSQ